MIIGIDADVYRIAIAVVNKRKVVHVETINRAKAPSVIWPQYDARLAAFMTQARTANACVFLEGIYLDERKPTRNVRSFQVLAEVHGEVKRAARVAGVCVEVVAPPTWQSRVLGMTKGRESIKAASMRLAKSESGRQDLSQHEADAICIAIFGERYPARVAG